MLLVGAALAKPNWHLPSGLWKELRRREVAQEPRYFLDEMWDWRYLWRLALVEMPDLPSLLQLAHMEPPVVLTPSQLSHVKAQQLRYLRLLL